MKKTGTKEWMPHSFNCVLGCANNCRYCYARRIKQDRFKLTQSWSKEALQNRMKEASRFYKGGVMFPTAHDITHKNYEYFKWHLRSLLAKKNKVLVVSKMSSSIAEKIIEDFTPSNNLEIRISISSMDRHSVYYHFEYHCPIPLLRFEAVDLLAASGFKVSVSIEPLLENNIDTFLRYLLKKDITEIWLGCLTRYKLNSAILEERVVIELYRPENLKRIYEQYKNDPKIKFKESFTRRIKNCL